MGDWFLGEIRNFPYSQVIPKGWMECAGQSLPITGNTALYSLLGVQFGGDGKTNFCLPDLRGRATVGFGAMADANRVAPAGTALAMGAKAGTESVALTIAQIPAHNHGFGADPTNTTTALAMTASIPSTALKPATAAATAPAAPALYAAPSVPPQPLIAGVIQPAGSGGGHENRQPFVPLRVCIATLGLYPPHQ